MKIFKDIILLGDIHGSWSVITNHIKKYDVEDTLYIQVGDFGIGFDKYNTEFRLNMLNKEMGSNKLYIIRGNHDDPSWFKNSCHVEIKSKLPNIIFIEDYTTIDINDEKWLFIGGAISIDRKYRINNDMGWWEDEIMNFNMEFIDSVRGIDRLVSHTCPSICPPFYMGDFVKSYAKLDDTLIDELIKERELFTELFTRLVNNNQIKSLHYGHFHSSNKFFHNDCELCCLDVNEFILI